MEWARTLAAWSLVVTSAAGCAAALERQTIVYPDAPKVTERSEDCAVEMTASEATVRAGCSALGDVFVGDSGRTLDDCEMEELLNVARTMLCGLGATHAHYRRISDGAVTCSQVRAVGFHCPGDGGESR